MSIFNLVLIILLAYRVYENEKQLYELRRELDRQNFSDNPRMQ